MYFTFDFGWYSINFDILEQEAVGFFCLTDKIPRAWQKLFVDSPLVICLHHNKKWAIHFLSGVSVWMIRKKYTSLQNRLVDLLIPWNWILVDLWSLGKNWFMKKIFSPPHLKKITNCTDLPPGKYIYLEIETPGKNHNQGTPWIFSSIILTPCMYKKWNSPIFNSQPNILSANMCSVDTVFCTD